MRRQLSRPLLSSGNVLSILQLFPLLLLLQLPLANAACTFCRELAAEAACINWDGVANITLTGTIDFACACPKVDLVGSWLGECFNPPPPGCSIDDLDTEKDWFDTQCTPWLDQTDTTMTTTHVQMTTLLVGTRTVTPTNTLLPGSIVASLLHVSTSSPTLAIVSSTATATAASSPAASASDAAQQAAESHRTMVVGVASAIGGLGGVVLLGLGIWFWRKRLRKTTAAEPTHSTDEESAAKTESPAVGELDGGHAPQELSTAGQRHEAPAPAVTYELE